MITAPFFNRKKVFNGCLEIQYDFHHDFHKTLHDENLERIFTFFIKIGLFKEFFHNLQREKSGHSNIKNRVKIGFRDIFPKIINPAYQICFQ